MTLPQKEMKFALSEYFRTDFEQIPRSHDFHIALQLCAFPVADNSQQRDQEDIRTINAEIIASSKKG